MVIHLTTCTVDPIRGLVVHADGREDVLTATECDLIAFLHARPGETVTRQVLLREVWGYADNVVSRAPDSAIARLRTKIEAEPTRPVHLRTLFGAGYVWQPAAGGPVVPLPEVQRRVLALGDCLVDLAAATATRPGQSSPLTANEVAVLEVLARHAPQPVSRSALLREVWKRDAGERVVDTAIWRLRSKIERDSDAPEHLISVRGRGYRLQAAAAQDRLFGREADRAALDELVRRNRIVVLIGPAGVGKTTLARQVARAASAPWCELEACESAADVFTAVAAALGLDQNPDAAQLGRAMDAQAVSLVVLDNFEHLTGEASLIQELSLSTRARILVTSRARLGLPGEACLELEPLDLDSAVAMLEDRVQTAIPPDDARALAEVLEGLPLAIELASARTGVMSVSTLRKRLAADPLDLLVRPHDAGRHGALDRAIAASWLRLDPWERDALIQLTAFRGGFLFEAAEAVLDPSAWPDRHNVAGVLQHLRDQSLLRSRVHPDQPGVVRLSMYVAIQAFVRAQGDPSESTRGRHAAHYAELADLDSVDTMRRFSLDPVDGFPSLNAERHNLVAARAWALEHGPVETQVRLSRALAQAYAGFNDPRPELLLEVLERTSGALRALVCLELVRLYTMLQEREPFEAFLQQSLELGRAFDRQVAGRAEYFRAVFARFSDPSLADRLARDVVEGSDLAAPPDLVGAMLYVLATLEYPVDLGSGRARIVASQEIHQRHGQTIRLARMQAKHAELEVWYGDAGLAVSRAREALRTFSATRDLLSRPLAATSLAEALHDLGRPEEAVGVLGEQEDIAACLGDSASAFMMASTLSVVLAASDPEGARAAAGRAAAAIPALRRSVPTFWNELQRCRHYLGVWDLAAAEQSATRCLGLQAWSLPDRRAACLLLARIRVARQHLDGVAELLDEAATLSPSLLDHGLIAVLRGRLAVVHGHSDVVEAGLVQGAAMLARLGATDRSPLGRELLALREVAASAGAEGP